MWQGMVLLCLVIFVAVLIRNSYPWFPVVGLAAGLSFGIGTWVGGSKKK
jgi:hypothetical protein